MASTRFLTVPDVYERFIKGKKVPEADWDYKIIPETATALKNKYKLEFGNKFIPVYVTENMVGHKLGEFAPTRNFRGHSGNKKK